MGCGLILELSQPQPEGERKGQATERADAIEIRMRAKRRLDQLRQTQKETVGLAKPGPKEFGLTENPNYAPTLASQGIDKNLAHQARTLGALSEERFEQVRHRPHKSHPPSPTRDVALLRKW